MDEMYKFLTSVFKVVLTPVSWTKKRGVVVRLLGFLEK